MLVKVFYSFRFNILPMEIFTLFKNLKSFISFPLVAKNFYFQECFFNITYIEYLNMWNLNILLTNRKIKNNIVLKMKIGNNHIYTNKTNVMNI